MYLAELIRSSNPSIGSGPCALITPHTRTEPPPPCSVETVHLWLNSSSLFRRTYWLPQPPSVFYLLSSLKTTLRQYEASWSSWNLTKSIRRFLFFTNNIGLHLAIQLRSLNSYNLFLIFEREQFSTRSHSFCIWDEVSNLFLRLRIFMARYSL